MTRAGPLDLLGLAVGGRGYEDLLKHTVSVQVAAERKIQVLDLATLILLKEELGREKDLAALPLLRRTLQEREGRSGAR
jgi:hypothetical protein